MKKIIITTAFILFSNLIFSQDIYYGGKAGWNYTTITSEENNSYDWKSSFHVGGNVELNFSERFGLAAEVLFSGMGAKAENLEINLRYLSVPLFAKVYVSDVFTFDVGGQFAYLVSDKVIFNNQELDPGVYNYEKTDYSLLTGLTVKTRKQIYFQLRYLFGLSEFDNAGKSKNSGFQLSVGYEFH